MRSPLRAMLDRTISHQRATLTADAGGGRSRAWATVAGDVPAAIWPMSANAQLAEAFQRQDIVTSHAICTDRDLGAKAKDKIVDGSDEYLVEGSMTFANAMVMGVTVYVIAANLRKP